MHGAQTAGRRLAGRGIGALVLCVALYYAVWGGEYSAFDLLRLSEREEAERLRVEESRLQVDSLRQLVERLESDPATIEAVARERFGMIRAGELLYRFVEVDPAPPASTLAAAKP
jgi:cell division protein FtsB